MRAEEYLKIVTEQIRCKRARGAVQEELQQHMEDQKNAFLVEGMEVQEAEAAAVAEMGDPIKIGTEMDRIHRPQMAWGMIGLIGALGIAGLLLQFLMRLYFADGVDPEPYLLKQIMMFGISFVAMMGVCYWDYSRIAYHAKKIMAASIVLLFLGTKIFGRVVNGAACWIYIFGISFDARMMILLLVPLYGAMLYSWRGQGYGALLKSFFWMLPGMYLALVMPSIFTVWILFLSFTILLTLAIGKGWFLVAKRTVLTMIWSTVALLPILAGGAIMLWGRDYQKARVLAVLGRSEGSYQVQMVQRLLENSRWIGPGELLGTDSVYYVSDYTLAYVISCYGILAAVILVGAIGLLLMRFYRISLKQKNGLGMIMGAGCSTVLLLQLAFYLLNNLGIVPMGSYCPFLTYGGTGMIVTYVLFGILLSIYRYENVIQESSIRKPVPGKGRRIKISLE